MTIKVIVFDLDGTLYEDTHHFEYFAKKLSTRLNNADGFMNQYYEAVEEKHTLKVGTVYDRENDRILIQKEGRVLEAFQWDGTPLLPVEEYYPNAITFDFKTMQSIGDLWGVPIAIGRHFGLSSVEINEAFLETRRYMMSDEFVMSPVRGLANTLEELAKTKKLVLMTNSPQVDSERIVEKLGLKGLFTYAIFEAKKPVKTEERLRTIASHFGVETEEMMSVGDNWINEINPARKLGCSTIFIDVHQIGDARSADMVVHQVSELVTSLQLI
ncbi:HAD family hydrolase [Priestia koreensis]|uniref:Hydrolase n=1 Tax=Priestia koreensis TaxID=284581 RepID=A0A0M0KVS4_9BACI|nr:HAD family hydrolase [Priestia koreensis]KOO42930.1 hypothetical protein AMD01_17485 [Priestia koreensis]